MRKQTTFAAAVLMFAGPVFACDLAHDGSTPLKDTSYFSGGYTDLARTGSGRRNFQLLSQLSLPSMGGGSGSSMWGWTDPLTSREYVIMGRTSGTSFIDVTNASAPVLVGNLPIAAGSTATSWREPKVVGNYAFIGVDSTNHGMQGVDLTRLRSYSGTTLNLTADSLYNNLNTPGVTGFTNNKAHTLAINAMGGIANTSPDGKRYIYAAGTNRSTLVNTTRFGRGIHAIDVTNPLAPVPAGDFHLDGYTHEMQVVTYNGPDTTYSGKEIAFAYNEDSLTIVDVTNKASMVQIGKLVQPNRGYVHQGWLTPDQKYIVSNDELDERNNLTGGKTRTHFWDVSDLNSPLYRGFYDHATAAVDHNLYIVGDMVFQSNYTTGLRAFKLGNLTNSNGQDNLIPIAEFDTYAANNGNSFNGAWNNYPFFPSGNIAIADINGGLIMVKLSAEPGNIHEPFDHADGLFGSLSAINTAAFNASRGVVPEPAALSLLVPAAMLIRRKR